MRPALDTLQDALDALDALAEMHNIGTAMPPDEVFRQFQRLHDLPEVGAPKDHASAHGALASLRRLVEAAQVWEAARDRFFTDTASPNGDALFHAEETLRAALSACVGDGDG